MKYAGHVSHVRHTFTNPYENIIPNVAFSVINLRRHYSPDENEAIRITVSANS
jgi:hypothetical protein